MRIRTQGILLTIVLCITFAAVAAGLKDLGGLKDVAVASDWEGMIKVINMVLNILVIPALWVLSKIRVDLAVLAERLQDLIKRVETIDHDVRDFPAAYERRRASR